jgi:hypothetical protein
MEDIRRDLPWSKEVQGRDIEEIQMEECRPTTTPMVTNLKKVVTSYSELVIPRYEGSL